MTLALKIIQMVSAVLLTLTILVQSRGTGLSATFGGTDTFFAVKRGAEKVLATITVFLAIIFIASSALASLLT